MRAFRPLLSISALAVACATSGGNVQPLPDGSYRLECKSTQEACLREAARPCGDRGYRVLEARSYDEVYGPEGNRVAVPRSEVRIACEGDGADTPRAAAAPAPALTPHAAASSDAKGAAPPVRASTASDVPAPSTDAAPIERCIPGSTQRCFGPGACVGGQACLPDGSGYSVCDCGPTPSPSASPSPSPAPGAPPSEETNGGDRS